MQSHRLVNWVRRLFRFSPWNLAAENRRLRKKLSETRHHLRAANRGAERNARTAELLASRVKAMVANHSADENTLHLIADSPQYMERLSSCMKKRLEHLIQCGGEAEAAELMAQIIVRLGADNAEWSVFLLNEDSNDPATFQLWHETRGVGIECYSLSRPSNSSAPEGAA